MKPTIEVGELAALLRHWADAAAASHEPTDAATLGGAGDVCELITARASAIRRALDANALGREVVLTAEPDPCEGA